MLRNLIVAGIAVVMLAGCIVVPRGWGGHHRHGGYGHGGHHGGHHDRHYDRRGDDYRR